MQIVALGAGNTHCIALDAGLYLHLAILDHPYDLFGFFGFNAILDLDHLFDLVATDFLDLAQVQKAHIHITLGHLVGQYVTHLAELEFRVGKRGQIALFLFDTGVAALEVETGSDFLVGLINGILDLNQIGFRDGIERWHSVSFCGRQALKS